ncbi:MAG: NAD(P)-binding protein [Acidimicrobiales bacterium]
MPAFKIGVVGGSLGGLTAACLLRDAGHNVTIFERSSRQLEERGAGIGFLPATYRYPVERGEIDLDAISIETDHIRYLNRDGSVELDQQHRYLFSSWNTVYRSLLGCFDQDRYLLGHELVDFAQTPDQVTARFSNGETFDGDLLVAADGIGSMVRARLQPDSVTRYAGYVAWRGMVAESAVDPEVVKRLGDAVTYCVYANSHILVYPIPSVSGSVEAGQRLLNFVWYRNYAEGGDLNDLLTDRAGLTRELSVPPGAVADHHVAELRATAAARLPWQIEAVVAATEEPFLQTIYDIEVERMAFDRICLVGDSGFAIRPHAAAGTAKAADDAWQLVEALDAHPGVTEALAAWEPSQLALGRNLTERTRRVGRRSQVENNWQPGDPENIFGLHRPGD